MTKIAKIRPVLLSAQYGDKNSNAEVQVHLPSGYRSCGMVEITLDNGIRGLGEGYLAVFAPHVFTEIVKLLIPYIQDQEIEDRQDILEDLITATGYWSLQGAARHAISAVEIALLDCEAQTREIPVFKLLGGKMKPLPLYGSGGDSINPRYMEKELQYLYKQGIQFFKIRARAVEIEKVIWTISRAKAYDIQVAVDMTQNLANPGQTIEEVLKFENRIFKATGEWPFFLEESLGMNYNNHYPQLKEKAKSKIAGGETTTTDFEMIDRIRKNYYDMVQPDATVIGGIESVLKIFKESAENEVNTLVHCWGGPVSMMANYHAAIAGNGKLAEWPIPEFPLREEMITQPWNIQAGFLHLPESPGLGVQLTKETERRHPFKKDAVYSCLPVKQLHYKKSDWK